MEREKLGKHPAFILHTSDPANGGAPPAEVIAHRLTPNDLFFVRNHAPIPHVDPQAYRLEVGGLVKAPRAFSLEDLRVFPRHTITSALQCAGNRREELLALGAIPDEIIWGTDAVSNAEWRGLFLADVLESVGVDRKREDLHIAFEGLDRCEKGGVRFHFGGSIPIDKAWRLETLLADTMNGAPLLPTHGYPLRALVPGYIGARSVKWLARIQVQDYPSDNYYQQHAYKHFPPETTPESADWEAAPMLGEVVLNAVISTLQLEKDPYYDPAARNYDWSRRYVTAHGHAIAGARGEITAVEVSGDGGQTWIHADLIDVPDAFTWVRWKATVLSPVGEAEIVVRAHDTSGMAQPATLAEVWNFKGYMNNAWHRVRIRI